MEELNFDVLIIGGGPGGYTSAIRAAQLGLKVGLVEREELGGVCLNWGCIPTKSLLHAADVMREAGSAASLGIELGKPKFNLKKMFKRSRDVAGQLSGGISHLMKKNKIEVFFGEASFRDKNTVLVGKQVFNCENVVLATGASAKNLPHIHSDGDLIWEARAAMTPQNQRCCHNREGCSVHMPCLARMYQVSGFPVLYCMVRYGTNPI